MENFNIYFIYKNDLLFYFIEKTTLVTNVGNAFLQVLF